MHILKPTFLLLIILLPTYLLGQTITIEGKLQVTDMDTVNTEDQLVVRNPDGTLATRMAQSLPATVDTNRTWKTDLLLTNAVCNCGTLPPEMLSSLLDNGYSVQDLLHYGLTILQLYQGEVSVPTLRAGGVTVEELHLGGLTVQNIYDGGVSFSDMLAGGISVQKMLNLGVTPYDIYSDGVPVEAIYGNIYEGNYIFYLDPVKGEGLVAHHNSFWGFWGCLGDGTGVTDTAICTGYNNTQLILADSTSHPGVCGHDEPGTTITYYVTERPELEGWHVPSKGELNQMYNTIGPGAPAPFTNVAGFYNAPYWTSSEIDGINAWVQNMSDGTQTGLIKITYANLLYPTATTKHIKKIPFP